MMWRGCRGCSGRWWGSERPPSPTSPCPSAPLPWLLPCAAQAARGRKVPRKMQLQGCKVDKSSKNLQTNGGRWERQQLSLRHPFPWLDSSAGHLCGSLWFHASARREDFQWECDKPCIWEALTLIFCSILYYLQM